MKPYRILFFISSLDCGGAEIHLLNLAMFLKKAGHIPAVCTLSSGEGALDTAFFSNEIPLFRLPLDSLSELAFPSKIRSLKRILNGFGPDIVHGHLYHAEVVALAASFIQRLPLAVTRHSSGLELNGARRFAARLIHLRARAIIAVSGEAYEEAESLGCSEEKLELIANAVDTERFKPMNTSEREDRRKGLVEKVFGDAVPYSAGTIIIGSVGGLKSVKDYPFLIEVASRVSNDVRLEGRGLKPRFVIVGEGEERRRLEWLLKNKGLQHVVALFGYSDELERIYPLFDIFALTSKAEGVPLALLEAMASSVPAVATDVGGVKEALGDCGLAVPHGDVDSFVEGLSTLILDGDLRTELGRRARVRAMEKFDREAWGEAVLDIYRRMIFR